MKIGFRSFAVVMGLLFGLVAGSFAEEYNPDVQARDSLRLTLQQHGVIPHGKPSMQGIKEHAAFLMLIKNSLSLYRDGYLTPQDAEVMAKFIKANLEYTNAALAGSTGWKLETRNFLRTMHYQALAANQLITMGKDDPVFKGLMEAYQYGVGYDAYRAAQDFGIDQLWEQAL